MDDNDYEEFLASYGCTPAEADSILVAVAQPEPVEVPVILLGFEGQVDRIVAVPDRPDVLLMPLSMPLTWAIAEISDDVLAPLPTAKYRRVGEFTYRRVS